MEELITNDEVDLVITEDLARIFRRVHAYALCEECVDHDTRLIAINDQVDTGTDWNTHAWIASFKGEMHNVDTSKRIKRSLDNRFLGGGSLNCLIYGYEKTPGAKHDDQIRKLPEAEQIYDMVFRMAEDGAGYSEIADWLNEQNVPTGPICRQRRWSGPMVGRVMHNPILKGVRQRGRRVTRRHNGTGRHRSVKASPDHLKERLCPHLAFIEARRYNRVIAMLDARNAKHRRRPGKRAAPGKRAIWPGRVLTCGVCRRPMIHQGLAEHRMLMCQGSTSYCCWNSVSLNAELAADKLIGAIISAIETLPDFEPGFREMVQQQSQAASLSSRQRRAALAADLERLKDKITKLLALVEVVGPTSEIGDRLKELRAEKLDVEQQLHDLDASEGTPVVLPPIDQIRATALAAVHDLAPTDPAYGRQLAKLAPKIYIYPVQCRNGRGIHLRAKFDLELVSLFEPLRHLQDLARWLTIPLQVDLFNPPQHVRNLEQILALKQEKRPDGRPLTEREIAARLGVTQPVVQHAMDLHRTMLAQGAEDPYLLLTEPPSNCGKLRRHLHPRYRFEPLEQPPAADSNAA